MHEFINLFSNLLKKFLDFSDSKRFHLSFPDFSRFSLTFSKNNPCSWFCGLGANPAKVADDFKVSKLKAA